MRVKEGANLVLVTEAKGVLGLVEDGASGRAMDLTILGAAHLVSELLAGRLLVIGLDTTSQLVTSVGDTLLELLLSGLGGVGGNALLHLVGEILAAGVRHVGGWFVGVFEKVGLRKMCSGD